MSASTKHRVKQSCDRFTASGKSADGCVNTDTKIRKITKREGEKEWTDRVRDMRSKCLTDGVRVSVLPSP